MIVYDRQTWILPSSYTHNSRCRERMSYGHIEWGGSLRILPGKELIRCFRRSGCRSRSITQTGSLPCTPCVTYIYPVHLDIRTWLCVNSSEKLQHFVSETFSFIDAIRLFMSLLLYPPDAQDLVAFHSFTISSKSCF